MLGTKIPVNIMSIRREQTAVIYVWRRDMAAREWCGRSRFIYL